MASDGLAQEIRLTPFLEGLREGRDEALPDALYPPTFTPDTTNVSFDGGKWETRKGLTLFVAQPGSGRVRLLAAHYEADGTRIRLLARGDANAAVLYDYVVGTDMAFAATTGGTSLGGATEPRFMGVTLDDTFYFVDRAGALRKYQETPSSGNQVRAVALPARPSAAPTVAARTYDFLETWTGGGGSPPYGWTESDAGAFALEDGSAAVTSPIGGQVVELDTLTNPNNETLTENTASEALNSATIAAWVWNSNLPSQIQFQYGITLNTPFSVSMDMPAKETWAPLYVFVGGIGSINVKRFIVIENSGAADLYLSMLALPGQLQGSYLYVYTHYDSTTGRESEPSDLSNSGTPLDLSTLPVNGQAGTAGAFQKSAALTFTSDSGTDTSTNQIRIYRSGGISELTEDPETGVQVWCRVGTVADVSTTVSGTPAADATSFDVASATGLTIGDWIVIAKGVTGTNGEEFVRITNIASNTLTIARGVNDTRGLQNAHTNGQAVQVAFIDNVANEAVDRTATIDLERDDPPSGAQFIARTPSGRLVLANWTNKPTGIAISSKATPLRTKEYEVFPDGVDPNTRRSLTQGFRFELSGDPTDEAITGLVVFHDRLYAFTRRNLYSINADGQSDWGPYAVTKALSVGCLIPDTIQEGDGWLYWVGPGPRVFRWSGQGPAEVISHERINVRLAAAPSSEWKQWFAEYHPQVEGGGRYHLFYCPEESEEAGGGAALMIYRFEDLNGFLADEGTKGYDLTAVDLPVGQPI